MRQLIDSSQRALLDGLRQAGDRDRAYRQSQLDAAVRLSGKIFGRDYAATLSRAVEMAANAEQKAARA
jgi:hypothetical protein